MKKNKILTIKTILSFAAVLAFAAQFLGCSNLSGGSVTNGAPSPNTASGGQNGTEQGGSDQTVMVTVNGSIDFGGAFPEQIVALVDNSLDAGADQDVLDGIARSAFPVISGSGFTYEVYALENGTTAPRYEGTVADDNKSYTIGIPAKNGKTYYVYASVKQGGLEILSGKCATAVNFSSYNQAFYTSLNITLSATQTSATGKGLVSLDVGDPDQKAVSACVCYKVDSTDIQKSLTKSGTGASTTWKFEIGEVKTNAETGEKYIDGGIKSGAYLMTFEFYSGVDCSGTLLYSFDEAVNVFDNMTTSRWVQNGAEPRFNTTTTDGVKTTTCQITSAMVTSYGLTHIYVNSSAANDNGSGAFWNPKKTFAGAIALLHDANANYTIHITGTLAETSSINSQIAHCIPSTASAKSLTLRGESALVGDVPQDILSGGGTRGALVIQSSFPVTIENLKITNGKAPMGGGICVQGGNLILGKGAYITGNEATHDAVIYGGGGVYFNGAELIMLDGAVIEENKSTGTGGDASGHGYGGGVYLCSGKKFTMNGGVIKGNEAVTGYGGGVCVMSGTFTMTGGVIGDDDTMNTPASSTTYRSNLASLGGGVYLCSSGTTVNTYFYFAGGKIAYNFGVYGGGGIYAKYCDATIRGAIKCNGTQALSLGFGGGGLMADQKSTIRLENCTVANNISNNSRRGGAIYVKSQATSSDVAVVSLKGSVSIRCTGMDENDVCLPSEKAVSTGVVNNFPLTIAGKLTGTGTVATITPATQNSSSRLGYDEAIQVLQLGSGVTDTSIAEECNKFDVTPQTSPAQEWAVGSDGHLTKLTTLTSVNIGSFTFADGDKVIVRVDSTVSLNDAKELIKKVFCKSSGYNSDDNEVAQGSVLDFSKAGNQITYLAHNDDWPSGNTPKVTQPVTIILPPKAESNLFGSMQFVWEISGATNVIAPPDCTYFTSEDGIVYSKDKKKLCLYPGGRPGNSWTVPSSVTEIGYYAFAYGNNLKNVSLPSQLTRIGQSAFYSSKIESLTIPANVTQIDYRAFGYGMSSLASLVFENPSGWKTKDNNGNILMTLDATKLSTPGNDTTVGSTLYYFKNTVDQYYNWDKLVRQ